MSEATILTESVHTAPRGMPTEAKPNSVRDTELFVLRDESRQGLLQRIAAFIESLDRDGAQPVQDIAYHLNSEIAPGGCRLAIVASSASELKSRLERADKRLENPSCQQIHDRQGVYFFDKPLHPEGKLAVIFTGEGAQYLGMLGELRASFPEVTEHFDVCDRLSLEAGGRSEPISRSFLVPRSASVEDRAVAEKELWRLDNAVGSVLITNWGAYHALRRLGLDADVFAGHSAGEISALAGAGAIDADEFLFAQLFSLGQVLRHQEDDGQLAETVLLAAGTSRKIVEEICARVGPAVHLAMDNCPHQAVVAGPPSAMTRVKAELQGRGVVCERLPFRRPYHTPLFEPLLGPIAHMFDALPVRSPRKPVYSCVTAEAFPADPTAIRQLAVANWAARVEFTRLIERMYADGVRIFVESGPRGNLTSFVDDILRGRPYLAVASDTPQRSSLTQINHLAGMLAAHHVPLRLGALYPANELSVVRCPLSVADSSVVSSPLFVAKDTAVRNQLASDEEHDGVGCLAANAMPVSGRSAAMVQYLNVMEQFLDLQRDVTERFLKTRRQGDTETGRHGNEFTLSTRQPVNLSTRQQAISATQALPLLGEIIKHEPGRELLMRRRMDLKEDLYALDHTLGGRHASAIDPDHHGLPVLPMAFSVEMMAEVASLLLPGKLVIGLEGVRLHRWVPFDADDIVALEVSARVLPDDENSPKIRVEIRDLGNGTSWVREGDALAVDGTVLLGDEYPEPPAIDAFPLKNQRPCKYSPSELYEEERRLFHGPLFQAVCSTDRQGDDGIEGHLRTLPHSGLFRSMPEANLITDPLLIDASTHILGCWHLGVADQTGRVVFPYELGSVQIYGPRPAVDTLVKCRVRIERGSARQVSHCIDLIGADSRLWCRLHPAKYWRFYWPSEYTSYFRRKEDFLLGQPWPAIADKLEVETDATQAELLRITPPADLTKAVKRAAVAHISLSRKEWQQFRTLRGPDSRKTEWLFGRIVAKDAIRDLWFERYGERLFPADIEIEPDEHGRPVARRLSQSLRTNGRNGRDSKQLPSISISHIDGVMTAIAAFDRLAGIDVERIQPRTASFEEIAFDQTERNLLDQLEGDRDEAIARFWCAREAVVKALGRGLVEGTRSVTVREYDRTSGRARIALGPLLAAEFPERVNQPLTATTVRDGDLTVAVCLLERAEA